MKKHFIPLALASVMVMNFGNVSVTMAESIEHDITKAQPELAKQPLTIVTKNGQKHEFSVEIAKTPMQQEVGEMFRTSIPENGGMLFVWPAPQVSNMWMKNTVVPLDMVFIDMNHYIRAIAENTVPYSLAPISSQGAVIATLELQGGITEKLGITVGDKIESPAFDAPKTITEKKSVVKQENKKK
ncbi:UPF0127 family (PDB:3M7A) [Commensalibacter communis]|uniref:UPF0127 family n=2 Tax=Commensalibacter communis TaxID=2972786 RepID=A0A9W4XA92_9PROT|nr:UPF0127 family (PDB:3M7A) [Commensalibacter communis]CAI3951893.1 UPF0127 family (PDB:3M7A) [Commensalibacter communis]CAI3954481.1 UPF0127 family (PDB:3M7A) [Commensalibacter communis]CAI3955226.1 UPF0127 family (PDB:3M7A) [Commensalibacter communis]